MAEALDADGLVNATPIGMAGHPGIAGSRSTRCTRNCGWRTSSIFRWRRLLLSAARAIGCRTLDGSGMVVFQAAAAFDVFTGVVADRDRMLRSFAEFS